MSTLRYTKGGDLITLKASRMKPEERELIKLNGGPFDGKKVHVSEGTIMMCIPAGHAEEDVRMIADFSDYYREKGTNEFHHQTGYNLTVPEEDDCPI